MTSEKKKKSRSKPPKSRPESTAAISQPAVEDASHIAALSSFSPNGNYFAFLSLAVDKHRLRVYDTATGQSVAEHVVDTARVTALTWGSLDLDGQSTAEEGRSSPTKKKRRKRHSDAAAVDAQKRAIDTVLLGLSDGTVLFFSPIHARIVRTLSHASSSSAILSIASTDSFPSSIWTSSADGSIRLWDTHKITVLGSWKNDDRVPYSAIAIRPGVTAETDERVELLAAHHSIRLLSAVLDSPATSLQPQQPKPVATFTGHASAIKVVQWDASDEPSTRFVSLAEGDRVVYLWEVPTLPSSEGRIVASIPLDSDARMLALASSSSGDASNQCLLTVAASGKISIFPIPAELPVPASSKRTQHKVPTLLSRSVLVPLSSDAAVTAAIFAPGEPGRIRIARVVGGVRPVFDDVVYLTDSGEYIPEVQVKNIDTTMVTESHMSAPNKRYAEPSSVVVGSGATMGAETDDLPTKGIDGDLDVDLAELSLGQRLTALNGGDEIHPSDSEPEDDAAPTKRTSRKGKASAAQNIDIVPANSLTRTLIQALHSSDSRLLETCLAHSDATLIRNTVRRLPPQLSVPLVIACVERLGRGARGANNKGRGGGASSQRGMGLIAWVKTVLIVHSGHLMTMPDLVARLAGLHATLTSRLTLQESLLNLNGKLDMVLSQIELRSSAAPAPLIQKGKSAVPSAKTEPTRYVEGESEDEDEQMDDAEVEVESGDDAASIEDVELGGSDEDSAEASDEDDEDDAFDDEDEDGDPTMSGFIDDEAEEDDDDDGEDDDSSE